VGKVRTVTLTDNNVTVQSRVEAMRNKTKHKHFQSSLEEVLKDPLPPPPPRRRSSLVGKEDAEREGGGGRGGGGGGGGGDSR